MSAVSERVITIAKVYFGPAAESFLSRQCKAHLKIDLADLSPAHLTELSKWVEIGAGLLMDAPKAKEVASKISKA